MKTAASDSPKVLLRRDLIIDSPKEIIYRQINLRYFFGGFIFP